MQSVVIVLGAVLSIAVQQGGARPAAAPSSIFKSESSSQQSKPAAQGRWRTAQKTDPMKDSAVTLAMSEVKGAEGSYRILFSLTDDKLSIEYYIYDALPLGLVTEVSQITQQLVTYKQLQWRFDKNESQQIIARRADEFANQFQLRIGSGVNAMQIIDSIVRAKSILIQGLRASDEYLEFTLDASFAPFRTALESVATRPGSQVTTPAGRVASIRNDNVFLFDGEPTNPRVEGDIELSVEKHLPFRGGDAFLLKSRGGTDCPTQYVWVFKEFAGSTVTPEFGTCAVLSSVSVQDGALIVTMPDTPQTTYSFNGYALLENGKPIKQ